MARGRGANKSTMGFSPREMMSGFAPAAIDRGREFALPPTSEAALWKPES